MDPEPIIPTRKVSGGGDGEGVAAAVDVTESLMCGGGGAATVENRAVERNSWTFLLFKRQVGAINGVKYR